MKRLLSKKDLKPLRLAVRKPKPPVYTHSDRSGMAWRFVGGRPVSALADKVMKDCGLPPLQ